MSATNHTTNYELSQFLGTDKPAWLSDYNSDMSKIDTRMKANADAATAASGSASTANTAIGTLASLTTTAKTDLVAAINEVNAAATNPTIADGAITTSKLANGAVTANKIDFTSMKMAVPDYANAIAFETTNYTCPSNGFISVRADVQRTGTAGLCQMVVQVQRNGQTYYVEEPGVYFDEPGYNHFFPTVFIPVAAGDIVKLSSNAASTDWIFRNFYPVIYV